MYKIIYQNNNILNIITPVNDDADLVSIAQKCVPNGVKYKIIISDYLPTDRTFRNAWEYDFSSFDGYGEAEYDYY